MRVIPPSELIVNNDGSIFHLHLRPEQVADVVLLVGDPSRVELVAQHFDSVECRVASREFVSATGTYRGKRMSVLSSGIGPDNTEIVVTELDALCNVDLSSRTEREQKRSLTLVRMGTCGAIHSDLKVGDLVLSEVSMGTEGLLCYYKGSDRVLDGALQRAFTEAVEWPEQWAAPYFVHASSELIDLFSEVAISGMTISAHGFYAPQGRQIRLELLDGQMNEKIERFRFRGRHFTNYEMEGALMSALGQLLGHRCITLCTVVAQRVALGAEPNYHHFVERMITTTLDQLAKE